MYLRSLHLYCTILNVQGGERLSSEMEDDTSSCSKEQSSGVEVGDVLVDVEESGRFEAVDDSEYLEDRDVGKEILEDDIYKKVKTTKLAINLRKLKKKIKVNKNINPRGKKVNMEEQGRENLKKFKSRIRVRGRQFVCILCKKFKCPSYNLFKAKSHSYHCGDGRNVKRRTAKKVPCLMCDGIFESRKSLNIHHSAIHRRSNNTFTCAECGAKFSFKFNMTRHIMEQHRGQEKKFACIRCR